MPVSAEPILYEKRGRTAYVTLNRPAALNALDSRCHVKLREVFEDFRDDPEVWVAILTGAGERAFCAGADLKEVASHGGNGDAPVWGGITRDFECSKPIVAAINGLAFGGGTELVLASDIAVAAEHAQFGLTEPRVGVVAGAGGLHRLPRQIPLKHAMGMLLTGRRIGAHEALALGLVNEVVPEPQLIAAAERWAGEILECSPTSVRISKEAVLAGLRHGSVDEAIAADRERLTRLLASEDFKEGPRAFTEKRRPEWTGG
jgi:enoyl-CoA hydratase/carnithine racemase